ncbi:FtsX-like permease family protein [Clostridium estertheticum]|uniref:FtsX-like permease family protein n=1 Tax=Clostridium estertheticum TaxID=238834 RepID=UPI001C6E3FB8|nr:ABC transporter permease [Clostridium estertheticum]MBW9154418.1 ABC transporter permease [Clostridium estertheticum]WLC83520.1 ABC transporter permease [Clostridium estertheticum]
MNFFSMAVKNIQRKLDTYLTYFLSAAFAVTIFFIFCSIYYNPEFADFHTGVSKIGIIFKISSVVVLLFSGVFVYYANSLFIKSRKKEIAIYSLLGMRKKEIGQLLFLETLLVGVGSIISGILLGSLFTRFFSMILKKLMLGGAPGNDIAFHLTWQPVVVSIVVFLILFILNALYSLKTVFGSKLIDLLSAEKEGETAPKFSVVLSVLSILMIFVSYLVFLNFNGDAGAMKLIGPAIFACVLLATGTYLLFQNIVIWLLSKCKKNIMFYYKTGNFISTSQNVYRIKANSNIFCVIALLSAFTVTVMSAAISFYLTLGNSMPIYAPYSYLCENLNEVATKQVLKTVSEDDTVKLHAVTDLNVLSTSASLKGYKVDTNNAYEKTRTQIGEDLTIDIIRFSDYQKVVEDTEAIESKGNKGALFVSKLTKGECLFLDGNYGHDYSEHITNNNIQVKTDGGITAFKIVDVSLFKYIGAAHARTTLVLEDSDYERYFALKDSYKICHYIGLKFDNPLEVSTLFDKLNTIVATKNHDKSYLEYHQILFNMYGAYIFIGMFLGILFLMAAGSIIFYKQLMEARDDMGRYEILRKIGMTEKEMLKSVRRQIAIVFLLPFMVAMMHTVVILKTYQNMVYTLTTDSPILVYALLVVAIYFTIYGLFYLFSVKGYMKTVWNKSTVS